tara:strand:- start:304 stop:924 length:621 start_codon:yes stop_codon:yes gene_type:complete
MAQFAVAVEGIEKLRDIQNLDKDAKKALVQSLNKIARDYRAESARRIADQINLPKRSLGPAAGNLTVSKTAQAASMEARIKAKGRPTSLAKFSKGTPGKAGVTVEVKPGQSTFMRKAFLIKLPQGKKLTDTRFNLGLAIRLAPGERLSNKTRQVKLSKGLYLLYGPSIQQIFLDNQGKGVADDVSDPAADALEREFLRILGYGFNR